jgi:hypothetical protein
MKPPRTITAAEFKRTRPDRATGPSRPGKGRPYVRTSPASDRTVDGITFASKAEATRYLELRAQRAAGRIALFIRQPKFDLAGAVYTGDFLVLGCGSWGLGPLTVEEVKGAKSHPEVLRRFRRNQKQMLAIWGINVVLVER